MFFALQIIEAGADPGFPVRGAHLKKMRRAEGGAKIFGVFRVKNHDFTPKNHIFSNCGGRRENIWGISGSAPGCDSVVFFVFVIPPANKDWGGI